MAEKIRVSVVVPVYNAALYIKQCAVSILHSSLRDVELILVDDGSTDASPSLCDEIAGHYGSRVTVVHKTNTGPGGARNAGIFAARGTYIGFVDADDFVQHDMFETLYKSAEYCNADLAFCDYISINDSGSVRFREGPGSIFPRERIFREFVPYFFGYSASELSSYKSLCPFADYRSYVWRCIYKTRVLKDSNILFTEQKKYYNEDNLFNLDFLLASQKIVHVPKCLYHYRDYEDSLTKKFDPGFIDAKVNKWTYLKDKINEFGLPETYMDRLRNKICVETANCVNYYAMAVIPKNVKLDLIKKTLCTPEVENALASLDISSLPPSQLRLFFKLARKKSARQLLALSGLHSAISKTAEIVHDVHMSKRLGKPAKK